jgi:ABC-type transport system substrate-binding protein
MRSLCFLLLLAALLLAACTATPEPLPTPVPTNTTVPVTPTPLPQREPLLRIAVLGEATTTNVWALFNETGANYWNYATQAGYWPSLYYLAPPSLDFESATAKGEPTPLICDAAICTTTVSLQPDLTWTNGSPLTAEDVAFTANTALDFRLGLNWRQAYNPDVLDHVEALDESTVKFYLKGMPTIADWQYGVLQGPILNQAYWQPRIVKAVDLLPDETLLPTIRELEAKFADLQFQVDGLNSSLNSMAPASTVYQDTSRQAKELQEELNSVYNKLEKNRTEYETKLAEARAALFALANTNEPTLGPWRFKSRIEGNFENRANLGTPFGNPWFDNVRYITYPNEAAAVNALLKDDVDVILTPAGLSTDSVARLESAPEITLSRDVTRSARFLVFNHANPYLADPALHQALACMLAPQTMAGELSGVAAPLTGFVLDDFWQNMEASLPCAGVADYMRLTESVELLKAAGYTWSEEPGPDTVGKGLKTPDGTLIPHLSLLSPTYAVDTQRAEAAVYIARQASSLGLKLDVRLSAADELLYEVYGSGNYDMVLLGWRLSIYPAYLCEWFALSEENPFAYSGSRLKSACEAWEQTGNLEEARIHVSEIQSILMQDLPLIPLYTGVRVDAYRNIRYPFDDVVDGLSGLYAAPALAIPIP